MLEDIPEVCFTFWLILGCFGGSEKLHPDLKSQLPTVPKVWNLTGIVEFQGKKSEFLKIFGKLVLDAQKELDNKFGI